MAYHGGEVLTAMDVVLRLEKKVDKILDDHEDRLRIVEADISAKDKVAAALLADDNKGITANQRKFAVAFAVVTILMNFLTLGPDLIRSWFV